MQQSDNNLQVLDADNLPALRPDLSLQRQADGKWRIAYCSAHLAQLLSLGVPEELQGCLSADVFSPLTPSLEELAQEAYEAGAPLTERALRWHAPRGAQMLQLNLDIVPRQDQPGWLDLVFSTAGSAQVREDFYGLLGCSPQLHALVRRLRRYAQVTAPVVITGETGTGKELAAQALHKAGPRRQGPFVALNCSALTQDLLESELFGHERGAFTGAVQRHRGVFEQAHGGTLFLDELGEMALSSQAKLLRVLETGQLMRVGGEQPQTVDVRLVAATHLPLERLVGDGRFRADLYHRVAVLRLHMPPLRERPEDIPLLAQHFLQQLQQRYSAGELSLSAAAQRLLQSYFWPGNIRELRNVIERLVVEAQGPVIGTHALQEWVQERQQFFHEPHNSPSFPQEPSMPLPLPYHCPAAGSVCGLNQLTTADLHRIYQSQGKNLSAMARYLGVHRATLYRCLQRRGLSRSDLGTSPT